ncbi:MAG: GerMN domain-containing protein [Roseiflexaceae bacterium]|nr:GerMN domain-containing protein [Roseiflexaceae bacterium]
MSELTPTGPGYCPYLGLKQNRAIRFSSPTPEHRCYASGEPVDIPVDQSTFCLSRNHVQCPLYMGLTPPSMPAAVGPSGIATVTPGGLRGWLRTLSPRDRAIYVLMLGMLAIIVLVYAIAGWQTLTSGAPITGAPSPTAVTRLETATATPSPEPTPSATATPLPPTPTALPTSTPSPQPTPSPTLEPVIIVPTAIPTRPTDTVTVAPSPVASATALPSPTSQPVQPSPTSTATTAPSPTSQPVQPSPTSTATTAPSPTSQPVQPSPTSTATTAPTAPPTAPPQPPTVAPPATPRPPAPTAAPAVQRQRLWLYFGDATGTLFVPVQRLVPVEDRKVATAAINALIEGPRRGLQRLIDPQARLLSITINNGLATVNFDRPPHLNGDPRGLQSIVLTLTHFETINRVQFQVNGKNIGIDGSGPIGRPVVNPLNPDNLPVDYAVTEFLPTYYLANDGYHTIRIIRMVPKTRQVAEGTVRALIEGPGIYEYAVQRTIPPGTELRAISINQGVVRVDFSARFAEAANRTAAVRTLVELLTTLPRVTGVQIFVEGRSLAEWWGEPYGRVYPKPLINPEE